MWKCPGCGREFQRTNQGHYCGKAPETVDQYIELQSPEARMHIIGLRNIILRCVPGVAERIAWSMPVYRKDGFSVSFTACKKHVSLYLEDCVLETLREQLSGFVVRKNAVYLPYDRELPLEVLESAVGMTFRNQNDEA